MIDLQSTYASLPDIFHEAVLPSASVAPTLLAFNHALAERMGLDLGGATDAQLADLFSGRSVPDGARPIAMAYAGHQFGHFVPQLGDGRAILLGEVVAPDGRRFDIHLKGAGRTRYSRGGDGRSSLGPVVREYLVSEAMHALGIPTTRALAAVATGETVWREEPSPGGVLARVASSHIRVGTFEFFAARQRFDDLRALADYAIDRHHPDLAALDDPGERYLAFFDRVASRKLDLVARWMGVGFIHGVMNTDNTSIAGETIDFGPCAFMDTFRHDKVFSSIDHYGRYRYRTQGQVAIWNLAVLANCLVPLLGDDLERGAARLGEVMQTLQMRFDQAWLRVMAAKLGVAEPEPSDAGLVGELLDHLETARLDFTQSFHALADAARGEDPDRGPTSIALPPQWRDRWLARLGAQPGGLEGAVALMRRTNPWLIPRNHQVEAAIAGANAGDRSRFDRLREAWRRPFEVRDEDADLAAPPAADEVVYQTFCGT